MGDRSQLWSQVCRRGRRECVNVCMLTVCMCVAATRGTVATGRRRCMEDVQDGRGSGCGYKEETPYGLPGCSRGSGKFSNKNELGAQTQNHMKDTRTSRSPRRFCDAAPKGRTRPHRLHSQHPWVQPMPTKSVHQGSCVRIACRDAV